ncbi:LamG domain-containing protein [bacterium]|nr:LamG domain-containing protein [bacterium]
MKTVVVQLNLVYISFIVMSLMLTGISDAKIDPETIVGMWLFDEGKGDTVKDYSLNGLDGEIKGKVNWVEGKYKKALKFDGTGVGHIVVKHNEKLDLQKYTIALWMNIDKPTGKWQGVVVKQNPRCYGMWLNPDSAFPYTSFFSGGADKNLTGKTPIGDGKWHHVVASYDAKFQRLYVDGKVDAEIARKDKIDTNTTDLTIGTPNPGNANGVLGTLDDILLCNDALSEDEIEEVMNGLEKLSPVWAAGKLSITWGKIKVQ